MTRAVGIVGAGAHGATAAYHLARRGIDTVLFERGTPASGPTGRASGVVRAYYTNTFLAEVARESTDVLATLHGRLGYDSGYRRTGGLVLHGPDDLEAVAATLAGLREAGVEHERLDPGDLAAGFPGLALDGVAVGVWEEHAGHADPAATTVAYAHEAVALGAEVRTRAEVVDLVEDAASVAVRLRDGTVCEVERLLVAAGPWTAPLLERVGVRLPLTAERHVVAGVRPPAGTAPDHVVLDVPGGYYARPGGEPGDLLLGRLAPSSPIEPDALEEDLADGEWLWLAGRLARRAPATAGAIRSRGWASLYDVSPDWQPVIGRVTERVYVDAGTSGHGFKLAPVLGDHVARLLLGDPDPRLAQFAPERFAAGAALAGGYGAARIIG